MNLVTLISISLGTIGVLLSIYFYVKSKKFKRLTATITTNTSVLEVREPVPGLEIRYRGEKVDELYILAVQLKNTGKQDISPDDFVSPLQLATNAPILDAKIVERHLGGPDIDIEQTHHETVTFNKCLFKVGEYITVKLTLLSKPKIDFSSNRIADARPVTLGEPYYHRLRPHLPLIIIFAFFLLAYLAITMYQRLVGFPPPKRLSVSVPLAGPASASEWVQTNPFAIYEKLDTTQIYRVECVVANTGKRPIEGKGFYRPLVCRASGIMADVGVVKSSHPDLSVSFTFIDQSSVEIVPSLLDPGDVFSVRFLLLGSPGVTVSAELYPRRLIEARYPP